MRFSAPFESKMAILVALAVALFIPGRATAQYSEQQLAGWLKQFPEADTDRDGRLTVKEANAYRTKLKKQSKTNGKQRGAPREFSVDPRWKDATFPADAMCYRSPDEIAKAYGSVTSRPKPKDGSLRIVATGHSFMAPGYGCLPEIAQAGGFAHQTLLTHIGGGITGSTRYKWEQENGIFEFAGRPVPKLLASISNAQWDAMMWGPYFNDQPEYYRCWIDFCLKYNPGIQFYLSDAWPQLYQLEKLPTSEAELSAATISRMGRERHATYASLIGTLNEQYPGKIFVLPTSDAMVLAAERYHRGELPGVEGLHRAVGGKDRSLWRDELGHLGPGFDRLEGYVFYATLYGRSPELIESKIEFGDGSDFPSQELDQVFRQIAWQAVANNALSGVADTNRNGIADDRE